MNITTSINVICVGLSLAVLTACSSTKSGPVAESVYGANESAGVEVSGLGESSAFPGAEAGEVDAATGERKNTVYFGYDQYTVHPTYMPIVEANAHYLKAHPRARVRLDGHTDPRGSREYNIGLGQRRGNQVAQQLEMMGVSSYQVTVVSYGKEKLAVSGNTEADFRLDRRVEIMYEER
jgi:peptidoglycan-associated lipoprotein